MLRWLIKLSLYYWLFFVITVIFDFCPKDTQAGKIIKQYQIKFMGKTDLATNMEATEQQPHTIAKILREYNQKDQQQPAEEPNHDSLGKLLKDYITK